MKCLCCGKEILNTSSKEEFETRWHFSCVKKFFGTNKLPTIDLSKSKLEEIANESTNNGFTVPGVQKKLSLHLSNETNPRLTLVNYPTGYILKPQTSEHKSLPEAEYLVMKMAELTNIQTVPFALLNTNDGLAYITKRIDRKILNTDVKKFAMEDFCQLENRITADKYKGSYERCAKVIEKYSSNEGLDKADLFLRIIFSFVIGNSDMHLKNFSLISNNDDGLYHLSEAYDMLPVNIILPQDDEEFALTLNGKKRNVTKNDFLIFAQSIGLNDKVIKNIINKVLNLEDKYIEMCEESYLPENLKMKFVELIHNRMNRIKDFHI